VSPSGSGDKKSFETEALHDNSFQCPDTGKSFNYGKKDMFWIDPPSEASIKEVPKSLIETKAKYTIVTRNRTPTIKPGEIAEIEIFLSGYGTPEANKLYIQLSSPSVLNDIEPGALTSCIGLAKNQEGRIFAVSGKSHLQTFKLTKSGATIILNKGNFYRHGVKTDAPDYAISEVGRVMAENIWDDEPPLLLRMNTSKKARSGDYDVTFTFTYGKEESLWQDYKTVGLHIKSRWERNQGWVVPIGVIFGFLSLIITAIGTIIRILGN
jgi:hypothetical protein